LSSDEETDAAFERHRRLQLRPHARHYERHPRPHQ
jgi:hypothetical protein